MQFFTIFRIVFQFWLTLTIFQDRKFMDVNRVSDSKNRTFFTIRASIIFWNNRGRLFWRKNRAIFTEKWRFFVTTSTFSVGFHYFSVISLTNITKLEKASQYSTRFQLHEKINYFPQILSKVECIPNRQYESKI